MNKLIELLNEKTGKERVLESNYDEDWFFIKWNKDITIKQEKVISKEFWFVERLVDNDKIDWNKCDMIPDYKNLYYQARNFWIRKIMIMVLSIQDRPIDFLADILK